MQVMEVSIKSRDAVPDLNTFPGLTLEPVIWVSLQEVVLLRNLKEQNSLMEFSRTIVPLASVTPWAVQVSYQQSWLLSE